jgi:hypothetical protein
MNLGFASKIHQQRNMVRTWMNGFRELFSLFVRGATARIWSGISLESRTSHASCNGKKTAGIARNSSIEMASVQN